MYKLSVSCNPAEAFDCVNRELFVIKLSSYEIGGVTGQLLSYHIHLPLDLYRRGNSHNIHNT